MRPSSPSIMKIWPFIKIRLKSTALDSPKRGWGPFSLPLNIRIRGRFGRHPPCLEQLGDNLLGFLHGYKWLRLFIAGQRGRDIPLGLGNYSIRRSGYSWSSSLSTFRLLPRTSHFKCSTQLRRDTPRKYYYEKVFILIYRHISERAGVVSVENT